MPSSVIWPCRCRSRLCCRFMLTCVAFSRELGSRAGGTRTPNRRFWRPVLCQIELLPSADGLRVGVLPGARIAPVAPTSSGGRARSRAGPAGGRDAQPGRSEPGGQPGPRASRLSRKHDQTRGRSARELALRQSRAVGHLTCARQQCDLVGQNHKGSTVTLEGKRPERTVAARPTDPHRPASDGSSEAGQGRLRSSPDQASSADQEFDRDGPRARRSPTTAVWPGGPVKAVKSVGPLSLIDHREATHLRIRGRQAAKNH